jgi:hypothetical protein
MTFFDSPFCALWKSELFLLWRKESSVVEEIINGVDVAA